jgi:hypothetical protein
VWSFLVSSCLGASALRVQHRSHIVELNSKKGYLRRLLISVRYWTQSTDTVLRLHSFRMFQSEVLTRRNVREMNGDTKYLVRHAAAENWSSTPPLGKPLPSRNSAHSLLNLRPFGVFGKGFGPSALLATCSNVSFWPTARPVGPVDGFESGLQTRVDYTTGQNLREWALITPAT